MLVRTTETGLEITPATDRERFRLQRMLMQVARPRPNEPAELPSMDRLETAVIGQWTLQDIEKAAILDTLEFFDGNKRQTSEALGVSLKTIYNKLNEYSGRYL